MQGLNMGIIKGMPIPLAPMGLQKLFAEQLDALNQIKVEQRRSDVTLEALFASLQHRAFRGDL